MPKTVRKGNLRQQSDIESNTLGTTECTPTVIETPKVSSTRSTKAFVLTSLLLQNVSLVLMVRWSRMDSRRAIEEGQIPYLISTSVVAAECLKVLVNLSLERVITKSIPTFSELATLDTIRLSVPSLLYVVQNNLLFVALGNLPVPVYQVTNQGKP